MPPAQDEEASAVNEITILNATTVEIRWLNHTPTRYHTFWLRYHCHCPQCKETSSGMRRTHATDVPKKLSLKTAVQKDGFLVVTCDGEDHSIRLPLSWLREFSYAKEDLEARSAQRDVVRRKEAIETFDFAEICQSEDTYFKWLQSMDNYGLALLRNVPCEDGKVCEVGELVAPVVQTLYGKVWNVESKVHVSNIAYLEVPLEFHQDLTYYESPPGLQFLHCIRLDSSIEGGANIFVDVFAVAEQLQRDYPELFETLLRVPATFQKIHEDDKKMSHMVFRRPHITMNLEKKITGVFWNPQAEGPLQVPEELVQPYYEAYFKFAELIEKSEARVTYRLKQGECVTFNNRRVVHSRKPFKSNGGVRRLQGIYINIDDFKNAIQTEYLKRSPGQVVKRMGNQCFS